MAKQKSKKIKIVFARVPTEEFNVANVIRLRNAQSWTALIIKLLREFSEKEKK